MADLKAAEATQIANIEKSTGKSLAQWIKLARGAPEHKHGKVVAHLKSVHGLTHGNANLIAMKALKGDAGSHDEADLLAAQYAGAKADLRPIYDRLVMAIGGFGKDVELAPKKAYVSARRSKQFAILQPSTASRFDLGLNMKGRAPEGRLEAAGSWNAMCSHRVRLASAKDVDAEVLGWLRAAYEAA
jgi:hypothetical protein